MNTKILRRGWQGLACACAIATLSSCIDENLEDCGHDYRIEYTLRLVTNLETELNTELETVPERALAQELRDALKDVFSDHAKEVDLGFYTDDKRLSSHEQHTINANQASFTIFLPVKNYMHLALANVHSEPLVSKEGGEAVDQLFLRQLPTDGHIDSHRIGLFTARQPMRVLDQSQTFHVPLYMQNCAAALVVAPGEVAVQSIRSEMTDLADGFHVRDSVYTFTTNPVLRMTSLRKSAGGLFCTYGVGFPSRDVPFTTAALTAAKSSRATTGLERIGGYWTIRLYVTLADGKINEYTLYVRERLMAGNLKIVKLRLLPNGQLEVVNAEVGVSVQLDWKEGGSYEV